jgi:hypothetical protein
VDVVLRLLGLAVVFVSFGEGVCVEYVSASGPKAGSTPPKMSCGTEREIKTPFSLQKPDL